MKSKIISACIVAAALAGCITFASAQGGSTDRNGNANGSQAVGNGAPMQNGTVGMQNGRAGRDSPNGSPAAMPKAKAGPAGDPSKDQDAPK
jgi:hypothetical protein